MAERRTLYEIYWEILVFCKTPRAFTAIINRCDLNSKNGQAYIGFLCTKQLLSKVTEGGKSQYSTTEQAGEYLSLFTELYQKLFDKIPGFRLLESERGRHPCRSGCPLRTLFIPERCMDSFVNYS
jgi:predicted transcriptional regulator